MALIPETSRNPQAYSTEGVSLANENTGLISKSSQGAPGSPTLVFLLLPFSGKLNFNSRHNVTGLHFNQTK